MNKSITPQAFVEAWMDAYKNGKSKTDLAKQLNTTFTLVHGRFRSYTQKGIKLPELTLGTTTRVLPKDLNKLIERLS